MVPPGQNLRIVAKRAAEELVSFVLPHNEIDEIRFGTYTRFKDKDSFMDSHGALEEPERRPSDSRLGGCGLPDFLHRMNRLSNLSNNERKIDSRTTQNESRCRSLGPRATCIFPGPPCLPPGPSLGLLEILQTTLR